jgi:hypothetical protein
MKLLNLGCALLMTISWSTLCNAEIEVYKSTDNTGINKLERIGVIEAYLVNLSKAVNDMDAKLALNSVKLDTIQTSLKLKEDDIKKIQEKLLEKSTAKTPEMAELEKLKQDLLALKNDDIEKMRFQIQGLSNNMDSINGLLNKR